MGEPGTVDCAPEMALAEDLFKRLRDNTADPPGITRDSYGPGERYAHGLMTAVAADLALDVATDFAGNLYITLAGRDRGAPPIIIGSHLDSVPHGGNFDGAAGVVAGLVALKRLVRLGTKPAQDVIVMAVRAEESSWFPVNYLGSRAAFGVLPVEVVDSARRADSGRTLAEHMAEEGFDPEALRQGKAHLEAKGIRHYLEVHIEQGPELVEAGVGVGIVTAIRGTVRYRHARIVGAYEHAAAPRKVRRDAVMAGAAFVAAVERHWLEREEAGADFVCTVGKFHTDPDWHSLIKVPGDVRFTLDLRSQDAEVLLASQAHVTAEAARIGTERGVAIDLGPVYRSNPAPMDPSLRRILGLEAARLGIGVREMPSGAGHDCMVFVHQGVPSAMIFVRNDKGSHNPDEAMEIADFAEACRLLAALLDALG